MADQPYKFDIALSYAGEQQAFVERVAEELDYRGIRVYFDKFDQANLWGTDLREHFANLFRNECQYCVVFSSQEYATKMWPTLEMENILARVMNDKGAYILPIKFDDTIIPGIPYTIGYLDARKLTPVEISQLAAQKLGVCEAPARIEFAFLCTGINTQPQLTVRLPGYGKTHPSKGALLTLVKVVFSRGERPVAPLEVRATDSKDTVVGHYSGFFAARGISSELDSIEHAPLTSEQSYVHGALITEEFRLLNPGVYRIAWYLNGTLQRTSSLLVYHSEDGAQSD